MPSNPAALPRRIAHICRCAKQRPRPSSCLSKRFVFALLCATPLEEESRSPMFMILAVILVLMWLGGFVMFKSAGLLIHLLLLFAVISLILHFVTGRRTV